MKDLALLADGRLVEVWTYTAMREVTLHPVVEAVLFVAVIPIGLFLIGLLFLVACLLIQVESVVPTALPANPYDA